MPDLGIGHFCIPGKHEKPSSNAFVLHAFYWKKRKSLKLLSHQDRSEGAVIYAYVRTLSKEANRSTSDVITLCWLQKVKFIFFNWDFLYDLPACIWMTKLLQDSEQRTWLEPCPLLSVTPCVSPTTTPLTSLKLRQLDTDETVSPRELISRNTSQSTLGKGFWIKYHNLFHR